MHGAGNDYIYVDESRFPLSNPNAVAELWSKAHTGIGADGLVLIGSADDADFRMRIFNADGSEAMMCGNASRCIGKYVYEHGLTTKTEVALSTLSGVKYLKLQVKDGEVESVTVDMGMPQLENKQQLATPTGGLVETSIAIDNFSALGTFVSMGNPHVVFFVDDIEAIDVATVGHEIEFHPLFPERVNVEFAQILPSGDIRMRVWERGSGITQACGTGACATAVAACVTHRAGRSSNVIMDGGTLHITWDENDGRIYMTGPATEVYNGQIKLEEI